MEIPETWKVHNVFNEALLTPYHPPAFANQGPPPPVPGDLGDDEEEHVVEAVVNSRVIGRGARRSMMFLVKWKGYPDTETSWEPEANLENAQEAIDDYYAANPRKMRVTR